MSAVYKGFTITLIGHPLYSRDWEVAPVGKEDEAELWEGYSFDEVKTLIDTQLN